MQLYVKSKGRPGGARKVQKSKFSSVSKFFLKFVLAHDLLTMFQKREVSPKSIFPYSKKILRSMNMS